MRGILREAAKKCEQILTENMGILTATAEYLLENETMDGEDFNYFCDHGELPPKKEGSAADNSIEPPAKKISMFIDDDPAAPPTPEQRGEEAETPPEPEAGEQTEE